MSILDGFPKTAEDARRVGVIGGQLLDAFLADRGASEGARGVRALLGEGLSLADILSITPEERDAVLVLGCRHLRMGDPAGAKVLLTRLVLIEPTDERALYALGTAHQVTGEPVLAGKLYLYALALDATNPDIYLRLGECFMANAEAEAARGCFEAAKVLSRSGHGTEEQAALADRMIAALPPPPDVGAAGPVNRSRP